MTREEWFNYPKPNTGVGKEGSMTCLERSKVVEFNMALKLGQNRAQQIDAVHMAFGVKQTVAMNITDNARQCADMNKPFLVRCTAEQFGLFILWCHQHGLTSAIGTLCPRLVNIPPNGQPCDLRPGYSI